VFARPGSKFLWIQYNAHGRQIRESSGETDPKKAEKKLKLRTGGVRHGIVPDSRGLRYEDLREAFFDDYISKGKKSIRHDKDGKPYLEAVKRLDTYFAGFRAVEIDADSVRKFQRQQLALGMANGSINRSVAALRRMFKLAQEDEKIRALPHFPMLTEGKPRKGILPRDKYQALLAALPDYIRPVLVIGFHTGMRLGEIVGLEWANVNWMDRILRLEDSKNNDAREIPFNGPLEAALREQYAKRQPGCERICFRVNRKGHAEGIGDFRKIWRSTCVKLGLGQWEPVTDRDGQPVFDSPRYERSKPKPKLRYTGLIFHDLRRTFVTDAEHAGAPRHEVMQVTGHRTESVYKRYAIGNRESRRAALAQIDAYRSSEKRDSSGTVEADSVDSSEVTH
jgi:integrase